MLDNFKTFCNAIKTKFADKDEVYSKDETYSKKEVGAIEEKIGGKIDELQTLVDSDWEDNQDFFDRVNNRIDNLARVASTGRYGDLKDVPNIYTDVVRYDTTQSLSNSQKEVARKNIDAISKKDIPEENKNIVEVKATTTSLPLSKIERKDNPITCVNASSSFFWNYEYEFFIHDGEGLYGCSPNSDPFIKKIISYDDFLSESEALVYNGGLQGHAAFDRTTSSTSKAIVTVNIVKDETENRIKIAFLHYNGQHVSWIKSEYLPFGGDDTLAVTALDYNFDKVIVFCASTAGICCKIEFNSKTLTLSVTDVITLPVFDSEFTLCATRTQEAESKVVLWVTNKEGYKESSRLYRLKETTKWELEELDVYPVNGLVWSESLSDIVFVTLGVGRLFSFYSMGPESEKATLLGSTEFTSYDTGYITYLSALKKFVLWSYEGEIFKTLIPLNGDKEQHAVSGFDRLGSYEESFQGTKWASAINRGNVTFILGRTVDARHYGKELDWVMYMTVDGITFYPYVLTSPCFDHPNEFILTKAIYAASSLKYDSTTGALQASSPVNSGDVVNKQYVDDNFATKEELRTLITEELGAIENDTY